MPWKKTGKRFTKGKRKGQKVYTSPSGRKWSIKQIRAYKAGKFGRKRRSK